MFMFHEWCFLYVVHIVHMDVVIKCLYKVLIGLFLTNLHLTDEEIKNLTLIEIENLLQAN